MKILVLDNYDSFTYNLVHYVLEIADATVDVFRNDQISLEAVNSYDVIILSPGPGLPADAGIMPALLKKYAGKKPILGVCLGHQAIGEAFGGDLHNLARVYHGLETPVDIMAPNSTLFADIPSPFMAGRYHSWVVQPDELPTVLEVTATAEDGSIMAIQHREYPIYGVQFHPESVMTPYGKKMLGNFLKSTGVTLKFEPDAVIIKTGNNTL